MARKNKHLQLLCLSFFLFLIPSLGRATTLLQAALRDFGQVIWERPISPGEQFYLIHRNSIYGSLVWEAFTVDGEGLIWLKGIKSSDPAVLEYYGLEDFSSEWIGLSRKIERIPLLITLLGEVRLEFGPEKLFLSTLLPDGTFLNIQTVKNP
jgi:hypothetical protein